MPLNKETNQAKNVKLINLQDKNIIIIQWLRSVSAMKPNCIWWWGSSSGDLGSIEYPFIAITARFTQILSNRTC